MRPPPLTELSLGCWQLGNLHHAIDEDMARATVDAAWDEGVRYFDTAPHYGLGLSERRLGPVLATRPRAECVEGRPPPRTARSRTRAGHRAPGLDRVDIAYLHDPDDHLDQVLATGYPALEELRDEGVVAAIGAGMNQAPMHRQDRPQDQRRTGHARRPLHAAGAGALDDLLPICARRGIGVVAAGVVNSGVLAHRNPPKDATCDYGRAPADVLDRARRIARVCERRGTTLRRVPLRASGSVSVCVGARSPEQIRSTARSLDAQVPPRLWDELRERGLLHAQARVLSASSR